MDCRSMRRRWILRRWSICCWRNTKWIVWWFYRITLLQIAGPRTLRCLSSMTRVNKRRWRIAISGWWCESFWVLMRISLSYFCGRTADAWNKQWNGPVLELVDNGVSRYSAAPSRRGADGTVLDKNKFRNPERNYPVVESLKVKL